MTDRELMQMALDALSNFDKGNHGMRWQVPVIKALRTRLAEPEETVTFGLPTCLRCGKTNPAEIHTCTPIDKWQGLTEDEVSEILDDVIGFNSCFGPETDFARAIEAKLKEKNT